MAGDQRVDLYRRLVGAKAPANEAEFAGLMLLPDEPVLAALSGLIGQRTGRLLLTPRVLVELDLGRHYVADVISLTQVTGWQPGSNWRGAQVDIAATRRLVHLGRITAGTLEPFLNALQWATSNMPASGISIECDPVVRISNELVTRLRGADSWLVEPLKEEEAETAEAVVGAELSTLCGSVLGRQGPSYAQSELLERFAILLGLLAPPSEQVEDFTLRARGLIVSELFLMTEDEPIEPGRAAALPHEVVAGRVASWTEVIAMLAAGVEAFAGLGFEDDRARQLMHAQAIRNAMMQRVASMGGEPPPAARPAQGPNPPRPQTSPAADSSPKPPVPPRGWHDDPLSPNRLRYSDGAAWTDQTAEKEPAPVTRANQVPAAPQLPPSGWYADPQMQGRLRFWDGTAWTSSTAEPT